MLAQTLSWQSLEIQISTQVSNRWEVAGQISYVINWRKGSECRGRPGPKSFKSSIMAANKRALTFWPNLFALSAT